LKRPPKSFFFEPNVAAALSATISPDVGKTNGPAKPRNSIGATAAIAAAELGQTVGPVVRATESVAGHGPEPEAEKKVRRPSKT